MLPAAAARKKDRHRNLDSLSCLTRVQKGVVCSVLLDISSSAARSLSRSRSLCLPLPFHELGKAAAAAATCIAVSQAGRAGGRAFVQASNGRPSRKCRFHIRHRRADARRAGKKGIKREWRRQRRRARRPKIGDDVEI
jgi:hypothetical protein